MIPIPNNRSPGAASLLRGFYVLQKEKRIRPASRITAHCAYRARRLQYEEITMKDGNVVSSTKMNLCLSVDHRIIDGIVAAKFLKTLKSFIEEPFTILL